MGLLDFLKSDQMPGGKGEFGHDVTNPIPTNGIPASYEYLETLRLADGSEVTYSRYASTMIDGINGNIDIWHIFSAEGEQIATLHTCPYHSRTSRKAPKGFVLSS